MAQSKPLTIKDLLLLLVLNHAGCETSIRSFQELENDPKALEIYQSKKTIRRRVYRFWRRDPKGKLITPENSCLGKMTPNKIQLWGATLWDFYFTNRIPSIPNLRTISTGSKLLKWMTKQGEIDHAIGEMASAANEEDPREILPFPISEVIEAQEMNIRLGIYGISKSIDEDQRSDEAKGVFCPESYPAPWPLLPFSYEAAPLEQYIPLYQLPSTLVVHDPWDLLSVSKRTYGYSNKEYDWASSEDRTYLYHQDVSKKGEERNEEEHKTKEEEKTRQRLKSLEDLHIDDPDILSDNLDAILLVPSSVKPGPSEPPILVLYEAAPDPKPAEVAHLYLSPAEIIGEGNHSLVANAEWEIPRSLIVPDILCYECILEDVQLTLLALDGADGSMKDEKWKAKSGVWQEHQVGRPAEVIGYKKIQLDSENSASIQPTATYVLRSASLETKYKYVGPFRPIKTNVKWQNGENYCAHISKRLHIDEGTRAHPLSAKVSVATKLSMQGDHHLSNESNIYQTFPRHFFEHWNGYNVVAPFETPTPVGAVVPQYYGYYMPPKDASRKQYLSPIMLLEKCGSQVVVDDLNMDDTLIETNAQAYFIVYNVRATPINRCFLVTCCVKTDHLIDRCTSVERVILRKMGESMPSA